MYLLLIPIILYSLSGIADAVMDTIKDHYSISKFSKLNRQYWDPSISWLNKYVDGVVSNGFIKISIFGIRFTKPVAFTDAWHLFKSIKEVLIGIAITSGFLIGITLDPIIACLFLGIMGAIRNSCFSLFYDKLLRLK